MDELQSQAENARGVSSSSGSVLDDLTDMLEAEEGRSGGGGGGAILNPSFGEMELVDSDDEDDDDEGKPPSPHIHHGCP